jgi:serine/threonine protein kinase
MSNDFDPSSVKTRILLSHGKNGVVFQGNDAQGRAIAAIKMTLADVPLSYFEGDDYAAMKQLKTEQENHRYAEAIARRQRIHLANEAQVLRNRRDNEKVSEYIVKYLGETPGEDGLLKELFIEIVPGQSIEAMVTNRSLPDDTTKQRVLMDVACAIKHLHELNLIICKDEVDDQTYQRAITKYYRDKGGVAHRDLHPGNVMITTLGNSVKFIDFGFARDGPTEKQRKHDIKNFGGILATLFPQRGPALDKLYTDCFQEGTTVTAIEICQRLEEMMKPEVGRASERRPVPQVDRW